MLASRLLLTCASLAPCHQRAAPCDGLSKAVVVGNRRSAIIVGLGAIYSLRAPHMVHSMEVVVTASDVAYASADVVACGSYMRRVLDLIRSEPDIRVVNSVLNRPPFSSFGSAAKVLVNGPSNLDSRQRSAILNSPFPNRLASLRQSIAAGDEKQAKMDAKAVQKVLDDITSELAAAGLL
jgi:hypothetical protein